MGKYLNPRADLTFKKVFADHKDLMISFLNAMLPLPDDGQVTSIEYLPFELIPTMPLKKDTIVDVRCEDQRRRQFIVEMQMIWTADFFKRVLFNSSKAYVKQLRSGEDYSDLQPVIPSTSSTRPSCTTPRSGITTTGSWSSSIPTMSSRTCT